MATKLSKPIVREIETGGKRPVIVRVTKYGVSVRGKNTQREVEVSWIDLVQRASFAANGPAHGNTWKWMTE